MSRQLQSADFQGAEFYCIALGSNRRSAEHGDPRANVRAAMLALQRLGSLERSSDIVETEPLGPSRRRFANAAILLRCDLDPPKLLAGLKAIERHFGRRRGRRWGARVIDLDIILWSGGAYRNTTLTIPHPDFRTRSFVLKPAAQIAAEWRDPATGLSVRQLLLRHNHPKPLDRAPRTL